ncbi:MAG: transposase-like zinc-binding domain-containing protein [Methylobacter sp.]
MNCPQCSWADCSKDGIVNGKQRYRCKSCGYRPTVQYRGISPAIIKRQALQLYLEGFGFRSIGRFLKCSHVAVYNWIRAHGESIEAIRSAAGVDVVERDEMPTISVLKKRLLDIAEHRCLSPYYRQIPDEFVHYLHNERQAKDDPPFWRNWRILNG